MEKAGIHVAAFNGHLPPMAVQQMKTKFKDLHLDGLQFFATGRCVHLPLHLSMLMMTDTLSTCVQWPCHRRLRELIPPFPSPLLAKNNSLICPDLMKKLWGGGERSPARF